MSLNPDFPSETSQWSAPSRSVPPGVPLRYRTLAKLAGSETVRLPRPRRRIQSLSHAAVGRPVRSIWTFKYSVSVERPGFSASAGFGVAVAPGEGDVVPPGAGDVVSVGEPVGEGDPSSVGDSVGDGLAVPVGDCDAASGNTSSIAISEKTAMS